jgi:hypothetical protein
VRPRNRRGLVKGFSGTGLVFTWSLPRIEAASPFPLVHVGRAARAARDRTDMDIAVIDVPALGALPALGGIESHEPGDLYLKVLTAGIAGLALWIIYGSYSADVVIVTASAAMAVVMGCNLRDCETGFATAGTVGPQENCHDLVTIALVVRYRSHLRTSR